jgi:low affinity Fe/Cu permease
MRKKNSRSHARKRGRFASFAYRLSGWAGSPAAFALASATIVAWAVSGPMFGFSDTWQLVINTLTTLVTFLMVFLIQNTQNRDAHALQLKMDELIRATKGAHTVLLDIEELSDEELLRLHEEYEALAKAARKRMRAGKSDTDIPPVRLN